MYMYSKKITEEYYYISNWENSYALLQRSINIKEKHKLLSPNCSQISNPY